MKSKRRQINVAPALPTPLGLFCFLFELLDIQPIAFTTEIHTTGGKDKRGRYGRDFPSILPPSSPVISLFRHFCPSQFTASSSSSSNFHSIVRPPQLEWQSARCQLSYYLHPQFYIIQSRPDHNQGGTNQGSSL